MKSLIAGAIGGMCPCLITLGKVCTTITPVQFQIGTLQTEKYPLSSDANTTSSFQIRATSTKKYGFLQGLGAPPDSDVQIKVVEGNSGVSG